MPKKKSIDSQTLQSMAELFHHLSDPNRLRLLLLLAEREQSVGQLRQHLNVTLSAVSHQLKILRQSRLVSRRRDGQNVFYQLIDDHIQQLIEIGQEHALE